MVGIIECLAERDAANLYANSYKAPAQETIELFLKCEANKLSLNIHFKTLYVQDIPLFVHILGVYWRRFYVYQNTFY